MQVQIYNKTAEVAKKGKAWLRQVWEEGRYDPEKPVWRAEVRFYRDILSALQIRGIPDLREHLGDLLVYAVDPDQPGAWVRFVQPSAQAPLRPSRVLLLVASGRARLHGRRVPIGEATAAPKRSR